MIPVGCEAERIYPRGTREVTISHKITSESDLAGSGTGFVSSERARINVDIYDRTNVADAGPVIPVNRRYDSGGGPDDDLQVTWYENPDNIYWPWQTIDYQPVWPSASSGKRIVIASRLGSEGLDGSLNEQLRFDPARYEDVRIYHQADVDQVRFEISEHQSLPRCQNVRL